MKYKNIILISFYLLPFVVSGQNIGEQETMYYINNKLDSNRDPIMGETYLIYIYHDTLRVFRTKTTIISNEPYSKTIDELSIPISQIGDCTLGDCCPHYIRIECKKRCQNCSDCLHCINGRYYIDGSYDGSDNLPPSYHGHSPQDIIKYKKDQELSDFKNNCIYIFFDDSYEIGTSLYNAFKHYIQLAKDSLKTIPKATSINDPFAEPVNYSSTASNVSSKSSISTNATTTLNTNNSNVIPMIKKGGVYEVPVVINGALKLNFIFDSGASDVSISSDVALTLLRTGTITESDFIGTNTYTFADGISAKSPTFNIKEIKIGNRTIYNVKASISNSIDAPLLLGQSLLNRLGKVTIDYTNNAIVIQN